MKPIIFTTRMVTALLNTKPYSWPAEPIDPEEPCKSMTRRVIEPQPIFMKDSLENIWREPLIQEYPW